MSSCLEEGNSEPVSVKTEVNVELLPEKNPTSTADNTTERIVEKEKTKNNDTHSIQVFVYTLGPVYSIKTQLALELTRPLKGKC